MFVYLCLCTRVHACVHACVCALVRARVPLYVCLFVCVLACVQCLHAYVRCVHAFTRTCVCTCVYFGVVVHVWVCVCANYTVLWCRGFPSPVNHVPLSTSWSLGTRPILIWRRPPSALVAVEWTRMDRLTGYSCPLVVGRTQYRKRQRHSLHIPCVSYVSMTSNSKCPHILAELNSQTVRPSLARRRHASLRTVRVSS